MAKADSTLRRHRAALDKFSEYLVDVAGGEDVPTGEQLYNHPQAWVDITWGHVNAFKLWLLKHNYAVGTVNGRLSTVRKYAKLAHQAGYIDDTEALKIAAVKGFSKNEAVNLDEKREVTRRQDGKKGTPVRLTQKQAEALKNQPGTPQGIRDRLLMCLLLDHGLRVSEVAGLTLGDLPSLGDYFSFYRLKVKMNQTHKMTGDTKRARNDYYDQGLATGEQDTPLLRSTRKGGHLTGAGMSTRAITKRVRYLGEQLGIEGLSAHDCRHYWATHAAEAGTDAFALRDAGGWSSLAMPSRYVAAAEVANQGVKGF